MVLNLNLELLNRVEEGVGAHRRSGGFSEESRGGVGSREEGTSCHGAILMMMFQGYGTQ